MAILKRHDTFIKATQHGQVVGKWARVKQWYKWEGNINIKTLMNNINLSSSRNTFACSFYYGDHLIDLLIDMLCSHFVSSSMTLTVPGVTCRFPHQVTEKDLVFVQCPSTYQISWLTATLCWEPWLLNLWNGTVLEMLQVLASAFVDRCCLLVHSWTAVASTAVVVVVAAFGIIVFVAAIVSKK